MQMSPKVQYYWNSIIVSSAISDGDNPYAVLINDEMQILGKSMNYTCDQQNDWVPYDERGKPRPNMKPGPPKRLLAFEDEDTGQTFNMTRAVRMITRSLRWNNTFDWRENQCDKAQSYIFTDDVGAFGERSLQCVREEYKVRTWLPE